MTSIEGVVTYVQVTSVPHGDTGALVANRVRITLRQHSRRVPDVECTVDCGPGNDGLLRADIIRQRLRPGTHCTAEGSGVTVRQGKPGDSPTLLLQNCNAVRGGEQRPFHERTTAQEPA